ncbi:hypothetical protein ACOMHN_054694 [Nucella lapillus]
MKAFERIYASPLEVNPPNIQVKEGENVTLLCDVTEADVTSVTWNTTGLTSQHSELSTGNGTSLLTLFNVTSDDHFVSPTCVANGSTLAQVSVSLRVFHAPRILALRQEQQRKHGIFRRLLFHVSAWPLPRVTWLFNGHVQREPSLWTVPDPVLCEDGVLKGGQMLNHETPYVRGNYTLLVSNRLGNDSRDIRVDVDIPYGFGDKGWPYGRPDRPLTKPSLVQSPTSGDKINNTAHTQIKEDTSTTTLSIAIVAGIVLFLFVIILVRCLHRKWPRQGSTQSTGKRKLPIPGHKYGGNSREAMPLTGMYLVDNPSYQASSGNKLSPSSTLRNIKLETILFIRVLGEGAFGRVYLGTCTHLFKGEITMVAVKTLKGESSDAMKADFEREAELLSSLQHSNIVRFYGVCTEGDKYMMIFEFMENGDLNNYLR